MMEVREYLVSNSIVTQVVTMESMFENAFAFDKPLDSWNGSALAQCAHMFNTVSGPTWYPDATCKSDRARR